MTDEILTRKDVKTVPASYNIPEALPTVFASNIIIQHQPDYFIVSYFEAYPPAIMGTDEQRQAQVDALESVRLKCVARIVLTPERMEEFIRLMSENLAGYKDKKEKGLHFGLMAGTGHDESGE